MKILRRARESEQVQMLQESLVKLKTRMDRLEKNQAQLSARMKGLERKLHHGEE